MVTAEQVNELANVIAEERASEVMDEFFDEVTQKTFDKYFSTPKMSRGGRVVNNRYYILKRSKSGMKKTHYKTKKNYYKPTPSVVLKNRRLAEKLMFMGMDVKPIKNKRLNGIDMRIGYNIDRDIPEYRKSFYSQQSGGDGETIVNKSGKLTTLDRLIIRSVNKWARDNDLLIELTIRNKE